MFVSLAFHLNTEEGLDTDQNGEFSPIRIIKPVMILNLGIYPYTQALAAQMTLPGNLNIT